MRRYNCDILVHTSAMNPANKIVRYGIEAERRNQQKLFDLAERFRNATNPKVAKRLADKLGRMIFGG